MVVGYHHFRKPPYGTIEGSFAPCFFHAMNPLGPHHAILQVVVPCCLLVA